MLFSQMIASMHVVGHLHARDILATGEHSHPDPAVIAMVSASAAWSVHDEHTDNIAEIDSDCLIYHAYISLNGFVPVDTLHNPIQTLSDASFPAHSSHVPSPAADSQRIRGPPSLS